MNPLHELIRQLPPRIEFLIVVMWAFGLPIFSSILAIGQSDVESSRAYYDDATLIGVLVMELVQSAFLIWFLRIRGWTLEKLGLSITWRGTRLGVVLLIGTYGLLWAVHYLASLALPDVMPGALARYPRPDPDLSMNLVFLVSVVNGIFEEVFVAGYIITALSAVRGPWTGINVSTGIRLLYHLYQGPVAILSVVPVGLLFGYVYTRTRLLWSLILAHIVMDIVGLSTGV